MSSAKIVHAVIHSKTSIGKDIYDFWLQGEEITADAKPGQFISVYCKDKSRLLPRPISICEINKEKGMLRIIFRIAGDGTKEIAEMLEGDIIDIMGPLGNGFSLEDGKVIVIGGGIGIPPMLELSKQLNSRNHTAIVLGYKNETFLEDAFSSYGTVYVATEDGSKGTKGNVLSVIKNQQLTADVIYACGPTPMLRAVASYAKENQIKAYLSLEERMACGIGACLACVCKTKERDVHSNVNYKRVCKDGPVFLADEIDFS